MGAPEITEERLCNNTELVTPLLVTQHLLGLGFKAGLSADEVKAVARTNSLKVETLAGDGMDGTCLVSYWSSRVSHVNHKLGIKWQSSTMWRLIILVAQR